MGYSFELFGASHIQIVRKVTEEQREGLRRWGGQRGISRDDMSGEIVYHDLYRHMFYLKTAETEAFGFAYQGSWGIGTVDAFFEEVAEFAERRGLPYTCPLSLGTSGVIGAEHCAIYAKEMDAILEQVKKEGHSWSGPTVAEWTATIAQALHLAAEGGYLFVKTD